MVPAQGPGGHGAAQCQAERAAAQAQQAALGQHQGTPLACGQAQHPQQRQRRRALRHRQADHRVHQERADEQGHQCEHGEVHAVGA
jgi:hypothetical protein